MSVKSVAQIHAIFFIILFDHQVKNLINQSESVYLTGSDIGACIRNVCTLLVHQVGKVSGSLEICENDVAVEGKKKLIKLVLIPGQTRDMKFHIGWSP